MSLLAVALPIVPDKTHEWQAFISDLNGDRNAEFTASRERAGVHERTFLQHTPMGDLVIVTLEGDDPRRSFGEMIGATDEFARWFLERVKAIHGVDLAGPMTGAPSELVVDSQRATILAK